MCARVCYDLCVCICLFFTVQDSALHDLNQRVDELQVENEYQLRLKTLAHNDVLMEMTEKFHKEMESLQKQLTVSRQNPHLSQCGACWS